MQNQAYQPTDKRQCERIKIKYQSKLYAKGQLIQECTIVDFSSHGLLVELSNEQPELPDLHLGANIQMALSVPTIKGQQHNIILKGVLVRENIGQYGVKLDHVDRVAIKIMQRLANQTEGRQQLKSVEKRLDLLHPFANIMATQSAAMLDNFLEPFLDNCDDLLFENARNAKSDQLQNAIFEGKTLLQKFRHSMQNDLKSRFSENVKRLFEAEKVRSKQPDNLDNMMVMGSDDFDDWLMIRAAASKIESTEFQLLYQLVHRINQVSARQFDKKSMPISPHIVMEIFLKQFRELTLAKEVERIVWDAFKPAISGEIVVMYMKINEWLLEKSVLPDIFKVALDQQRAGQPIDLDRILQECANEEDYENRQKQFEETVTKEQVVARQKQTLADLHEEQKKLQALHEAIDKESKLSFGTIWKMTRTWTKDTLAELRKPKENELAAQELLDVVESQGQKVESFKNITATIKSLASQMQLNKALSQLDKEIINFVEMFFDELQGDERLDEAAKPMINSLQLPAFSGILRSENMFSDPAHPLAKLINGFAKLGTKDNPFFKKNRREIEAHIESVLSAKGDGQIQSIEKTCTYISELVEKQNQNYHRNIRRVLSLCDGQSALKANQDKVDHKVNQIIANRKVPEILLVLLDVGWRNLLVMASMNNDEKRNLGAYWQVVDSIASLEENQGQGFKRKMLFLLIQKGLTKVNGNSAKSTVVIKALDDLLDTYDQDQQPDASQFVANRHFGVTEHRPTPKNLNKWLEIVDGLRLGDFINVQVDKNAVCAELVWLGDGNQQMAFVNSQGIKVADFTREQLAEALYFKKASVNYDARKPFLSTVSSRFNYLLESA